MLFRQISAEVGNKNAVFTLEKKKIKRRKERARNYRIRLLPELSEHFATRA